MIILGIDPGTATTGFGLIEKENGNIKYLGCGCITTCAGVPMPDRLQCIYKDAQELIKKYKPDEFAIEDLFFYKNITTAITVAQARGVLILAAQKFKVPIYEYKPLQIKLAITGYGNADKYQMQEMVKNILSLSEIPKPDDAADGLAVAITHANSNNNIRIK